MIAESIEPAPPRPDAAANPEHDVHDLIVRASAILRRALVARNGFERGSDAAADAVAWAWEHRDELASMTNPLGYLYRVGQSSLRRGYRIDRLRVDLLPEHLPTTLLDVDHALFDALGRLTADRRVAVVMVHMYRFTYREVAELVDATESAVTNHVHRGMKRLRSLLAHPSTGASG